MLEACQIIDFEWRYIYVNDSAVRQNRQTRPELLGHTMMERYPEIEKPEIFAVLNRCMTERIVGHMEDKFVYPDGVTGWFEIRVQPIPAGTFILSLEITERKKGQQALQRYARLMEVLHEIDMGIISAASVPDIVETALKNLREIIGCQRVSVVLLDRVNNECRIFADDSNQPYSLNREMRVPIPPGWDEEFGTSQIKFVNDLRLDPRPTPAYQQLIRDGLISGLQCLLMDHGQSIGFLGLNANTIGFFTAEHAEIAIQIASCCSSNAFE